MADSGKAVFLSYASQDAEAARRICEALRAAGVEVWFDQRELRGGDAWDQKIRRQIKECTLFVPIISANTQARAEGYFRIEWRLADRRTEAIGKSKAFIVPICIDDTRDSDADVPDSFLTVQWMRQPDGETTAAFCAHVRQLLDRSAGSLPAARATERDPAQRVALPARRTRRWIAAAAMGGIAIVAVALWRFEGFNAKPGSHNATPAPAAPPTEARKLALQARALIDDDLLAGRENFRLAEELCQRAIALDPADGEACATHARVCLQMIFRNYDATTPRRELARAQAERAIRLAPSSIEAGLATADYQLLSENAADAAQRFRSLLQLAPHDGRVALGLAEALDVLGQRAEAREIRLRHPAFRGRDPLPLIYEAGWLRDRVELVESDELLDRAQAMAPTLRGYFYKLANLANQWGDLEAAQKYAEQIPARVQQEDAIAGVTAWMWIRLGQGEKALQVLSQVPRDYIEEFYQDWPKGYIAGWAMQIAGRTAAAQAEWAQALRVVEKRLGTNPNQPKLLRFQALLLAQVGRREEAEKTWKLYRELAGLRLEAEAIEDAEFCLAVGRTEEAIEQLQRRGGPILPRWGLGRVRHEPAFAPIRDDPRVQKIIQEGLANLEALRRNASPAVPSAAGIAKAEKSIAVLAFENLSGDKDNEYFSDGISEELLNVLAKVPGLRVAARTSAFYFKDKKATAQEIGRKLEVAHLVDGSVQKAGTKVRIRARLSKAETGEQVWSESYEDELKDVFALQDRIARDIAEKLQLKLALSLQPKRAVNPEAHRLYLEGRHFWSWRSEEGFRRAEASLKRAIEIDPQFARAHAGLADLWAIRGWYLAVAGSVGAPAFLDQGEAAARKALELDPSLAEVHATFGAIHLVARRLREAEREIGLCLAQVPNYATALNWRAEVMIRKGRLDLAVTDFLTAARLDPLSPVMLFDCSWVLLWAGQPAAALEYAERSLALVPDLLQPNVDRARALLDLHQPGEAVAAIQAVRSRLLADTTLRHRVGIVVHLLRRAGADSEAVALAEDAMRMETPDSFIRGYILAALGRVDEAFSLLAKAPPAGAQIMFWNDAFESVRADPRFQDLMMTLGCAEEYKVARETLARMIKEKASNK